MDSWTDRRTQRWTGLDKWTVGKTDRRTQRWTGLDKWTVGKRDRQK